MNFKNILLILLVLLCSAPLFAAEIALTASVSKTRVAVGEVFEVHFSVNGNLDKFAPPNLNGFQVVGGPNQSSSMTSINGVTTVSIALGYDLVANREGVYTIGVATALVNGKQYRSKPIKITVVKGNSGTAGSGGGASLGNGTSGAEAPFAINEKLFIRAQTDKTNVYQGEQLAVTYKLYTNIDIVDNSLDKLPDFNGFWSQEIKMDSRNIDWNTEVFNGTRYSVAVLKKVILFPERFGRLSLDPLAMTFVVRQRVPSNDPMEQFFGGTVKDIKYKIKSSAITINVKPLPEAGKPEGFQGAVGKFAIASSISRESLKANEALDYKLKVSGSGNLKLLKAPEIPVVADIEKYDPKIKDDITETLSGVSGSREYTYLLIPRREGSYKLAPFKFSYFDPAIGQYVVLNTEAFDIDVMKGDPGSNVTAFANGGQQEDQVLDKDIRDIKTSPSGLVPPANGFYGSSLFFVLLIVGPLAFLLALTYRTWYRDYTKDPVALKGRKASKIAAKHMANAQKQLAAGDKKVFYEAVYKGLYGYLSDRLNISAADLNKENIVAELRRTRVAEVIILQVEETIDRCEMARYAPVSGVSQQDVLEQAKRIISDIENA